MMDLLYVLALVGGLVTGILLLLYKKSKQPGGHAMAVGEPPAYGERLDDGRRAFHLRTDRWTERDGTPYGAMEDVLMDADGEGGA